jgi:hypothetical protein
MIPGFSDGLNVLAKAFAKAKAFPLKTSPRRSWSVTCEPCGVSNYLAGIVSFSLSGRLEKPGKENDGGKPGIRRRTRAIEKTARV